MVYITNINQQYDILGLADLNMGYGINICQSGFKPSILGTPFPNKSVHVHYCGCIH